MTQDATTPDPGAADELRRHEASLAAARAEASRRFDAEIATARARAKEILDEAHDEAARIRATAEEDAVQLTADLRAEQDRLAELRAAIQELGDELRRAGEGLEERLGAFAAELAGEGSVTHP